MGERFTLWVVREGTERGKGRYSDGEYFTDFFRQCDAARFTKARAFEVAGTTGRPVRLVTLSEQLRRARKRIAELEEAAEMNGAELHKLRFDRALVGVSAQLEELHARIVSPTHAYQQGRADERAAVVAAAELEAADADNNDEEAMFLFFAARIRNGEHVKGAT